VLVVKVVLPEEQKKMTGATPVSETVATDVPIIDKNVIQNGNIVTNVTSSVSLDNVFPEGLITEEDRNDEALLQS
jgi:hypothetical protein